MELSKLSFIEDLQTKIVNELVFAGMEQAAAHLLCALLSIASLLVICWLAKFITQRVVVQLIEHLIQKTKTEYDDYLIHHRLFQKLSHLVPALIILMLGPGLFEMFPTISQYITEIGQVYIIIVFVRSLGAIINAFHDLYNHIGYAKNRPIKGYIQMAHITVYFIAALIIVAIVFHVSLLAVFTSLGAVAAVLLLIFKDTILGITASIQLSANDMVKIGDWISMPSHNADGEVIEITLYAVKVQNWDKTISTIPPYELVSKSFTNWKGMSEAGARRIKRSISIDMKSVRFCSVTMLEKFRRIKLIENYIDQKSLEVEAFNKSHNWDLSNPVNGLRLTNIGVFRKYLETYLRNHPMVQQEMTLLVRQLQPTDTGIPIEVYVFVNNTAWAIYENVQSDIFDHILAIVPEFELRVFQSPSGDDFKYIGTHLSNSDKFQL